MSSQARRASALLVAFTLTSTSLPVHAQPAGDAEVSAEAPVDHVELRGGGMIQGSILEILPNDSLTIVSAATGARKTFAWSEIVRYERGGARVEVGEAAPEPAPEPEQAPLAVLSEDARVAAPAGPRLHIVTTKPAPVQLFEITSEMVASGANVVVHGITYRPACTAPCDRVIDTSRGTSFFFGGDRLTTSRRFNLHDQMGDVTATVKPGKRGLRLGGAITMALGGVVMVSGAILFVLPAAKSRQSSILGEMPAEPPSYGAPIGVLVGGAALLAGGIVMYVLGGTRYKLKTGGVGLLRPLRFG